MGVGKSIAKLFFDGVEDDATFPTSAPESVPVSSKTSKKASSKEDFVPL